MGRSEVELKHLGFVLMVWRLFKAVVRPFYYKLKQVLMNILIFLDNKVDIAFHIFDKYAPSMAKSVVSKAWSMVKNALGLVDEADAGKISDIIDEGATSIEERVASIIKEKSESIVKEISDLVQKAQVADAAENASNIIDGFAPPIAKSVPSTAKKAPNLGKEAIVKGPVAAVSDAGQISKKAVSIFDGLTPPMAKSVLSTAKKASDLTEGAIMKGPIAAVSDGAKTAVSKAQSMAQKTSDLVQEVKTGGPIAGISYAGKISKEAFDKHAPSIAKDVVSTTQSMVKKASDLAQEAITKGPIAAISHVDKGFILGQMIMVWSKVNQYYILRRALEMVVPIAFYLLKKYNRLVEILKGMKLFSFVSYLPSVPVEEMENVYKLAKAVGI